MYSFTEMMMWAGIDKRKFPRVNYKCLIKIVDHGSEELFEAYTENIGAGGICVVLGKEFDLFKTAEIELYVFDNEEALKCKGTIVWVIRRTLNDAGTYEYDIGIEFTEISEKDKNRIAVLVDDVLSA